MRKLPADAFGLSLLDVLSNALGAVLLLMMIVSASVGGNDEERHDLPVEEGAGQTVTALEFKLHEPNTPKSGLIVAQIRLFGGDVESLNLIFKDATADDIRGVHRGIKDRSQWLVLKRGRRLGQWSLHIAARRHGALPDSISVMATIDDYPMPPKLIHLNDKNTQLSYPIFSVSDNLVDPITFNYY